MSPAGYDRVSKTTMLDTRFGTSVKRIRACYRMKGSFFFEESATVGTTHIVFWVAAMGQNATEGGLARQLRVWYPDYLQIRNAVVRNAR